MKSPWKAPRLAIAASAGAMEAFGLTAFWDKESASKAKHRLTNAIKKSMASIFASIADVYAIIYVITKMKRVSIESR